MIWHSCQLNVLHFLFRHVGRSVDRPPSAQSDAMRPLQQRALLSICIPVAHCFVQSSGGFDRFDTSNFAGFLPDRPTTARSQLERAAGSLTANSNPGRKMLLEPANERNQTLYGMCDNVEKYKARKWEKGALYRRRKRKRCPFRFINFLDFVFREKKVKYVERNESR